MLYKNIPLTSGNLSEETVSVPIPGSSDPAEGLTAVAFCVNCVESSRLLHTDAVKNEQNNADHSFSITYTDG